MRRELLHLFKPEMPRTPVPYYFVSAMNVKERECKAKEKEPTATSEGSGWLCENERTKRKGKWRAVWFVVVDSTLPAMQ